MKRQLIILAAACVAAFPLNAAAQTIVFSGTDGSLDLNVASGDVTQSGLTLTLSANDGVVNATSSGLGINDSLADDATNAIDTVNLTEVLTLSFDKDITFDSLRLSNVSTDDAINISIAGAAPVTLTSSGETLFSSGNLVSAGEVITLTGATPSGTANNGISVAEFTVTVVPEPGSLLLLGGGGLLLYAMRRRSWAR